MHVCVNNEDIMGFYVQKVVLKQDYKKYNLSSD